MISSTHHCFTIIFNENFICFRYELLQNQLVIKSARTIDTGSYSCVAKNNPGTKKMEFNIQVEGSFILKYIKDMLINSNSFYNC